MTVFFSAPWRPIIALAHGFSLLSEALGILWVERKLVASKTHARISRLFWRRQWIGSDWEHSALSSGGNREWISFCLTVYFDYGILWEKFQWVYDLMVEPPFAIEHLAASVLLPLKQEQYRDLDHSLETMVGTFLRLSRVMECIACAMRQRHANFLVSSSSLHRTVTLLSQIVWVCPQWVWARTMYGI